MRSSLRSAALCVATLVATTGLVAGLGTSADAATTPVRYKNCAALNKKFPHGVGKKTAKDKVSGTAKPVTTFTRNDAWYKVNTSLDRDRDGIACEKR